MGADYEIGPKVFEYQTPLVINQAGPNQNQWYSFGIIRNARVYEIAVNIEDTNETLEIQATVDGETIQAAGWAATHSTAYFVIRAVNPITRVDYLEGTYTSLTTLLQSFVMEGRVIEISVRKTTAAGVGNLTGIITWGQI